MVDFLPTILSIAQEHNASHDAPSDMPAIDGLDQWFAISKGDVPPRSTMVYNIDDQFVPAVLENKQSDERMFQVGRNEVLKAVMCI